jgi:hypothetical protein
MLFSAAAAAAGWYAETLFHSEISILLYFFQVSWLILHPTLNSHIPIMPTK